METPPFRRRILQIMSNQSTIFSENGTGGRNSHSLVPISAIQRALNRDDVTSVRWLAGDGSDRCYYRIQTEDSSFVLMQLAEGDAKALRKGDYEWLDIAKILTDSDIFVPHPIQIVSEYDAIIIEDYGDITLETKIRELIDCDDYGAIDGLYQELFDIISRFLSISKSPSAPWCRRSFDREKLQWELDFFITNYVKPIIGERFGSEESGAFGVESYKLSAYLAENAQYFVHRDFHTRNIMYRDSRLAIIDFQDARVGPASYDMVSLCFDSYVPFSIDDRVRLMNSGIDHIASKLGQGVADDLKKFWPAMLLQRQLKAIGSFGYLTLKKSRGDYLKYVAAALETLDHNIVFNKEWPFISGKMINYLRADLPQKGSAVNQSGVCG